jgi:integrase
VDRLVADGLAPTTIELSVAPLRAIYRRAEQLDIVRHNATRGLSLPGERRSKLEIIPPAKALALLAVIDRADRAVWATARYAGLRRGELYVLRPEDIDLAAGEIHVQRGWDFKESEQSAKTEAADRRVPIPAPLRAYLDEQLLTVEGEYVFGGPLPCVQDDRARDRGHDGSRA